MHIVALYFIHMHLLLLKNKERPIFCVYKQCLNSYIALSFSYLKVARASLDDCGVTTSVEGTSLPTH